MQGTVVGINAQRGMFIVRLYGGDHAVFELQDSINISLGDWVSGNLRALDGGILFHLGFAQAFGVRAQTGETSLQLCCQLIA